MQVLPQTWFLPISLDTSNLLLSALIKGNCFQFPHRSLPGSHMLDCSDLPQKSTLSLCLSMVVSSNLDIQDVVFRPAASISCGNLSEMLNPRLQPWMCKIKICKKTVPRWSVYPIHFREGLLWENFLDLSSRTKLCFLPSTLCTHLSLPLDYVLLEGKKSSLYLYFQSLLFSLARGVAQQMFVCLNQADLNVNL